MKAVNTLLVGVIGSLLLMVALCGCTVNTQGHQGSIDIITPDLFSPQELLWLGSYDNVYFGLLMLKLESEMPLSKAKPLAILSYLESWPDDAREMPANWVDKWISGEEVPLASLVRSARLPKESVTPEMFLVLGAKTSFCNGMSGLTSLTASGIGWGSDGIKYLVESIESCGPNITSFEVADSLLLNEGFYEIISASFAKRLVHLDVSDNLIDADGFRSVNSLEGLVSLKS